MKRILALAGDGIGPEIMAEAVKVIDVLVRDHGLEVELVEGLIGGAAYDETGKPLPDETLQTARQADAVLLGAVGGPNWEHLPASSSALRDLLFSGCSRNGNVAGGCQNRGSARYWPIRWRGACW